MRAVFAAAARTTIRTGNTPDIYPGMPGWLPSGNGRMIPTAKLVDGKPNGMWFEGSMYLKSLTLAQSKISTTIFFADGTMIEHPRFGSGGLVDIEGQKAKPGNAKLVGTWTISGGKMTYEIRGFHHIDSYVTGKDTSGVYFEINRTRYLPCEPVSEAFLQGTWTMPSSASRTFGPNCGLKISGSNASATYALDGYLLAIDNGSQYIVDSIFKLTNDAIVIGASVYHRQKG